MRFPVSRKVRKVCRGMLLCLLTAVFVAFLSSGPLSAATRSITIEGSAPPKERQIKADDKTKVIFLKGEAREPGDNKGLCEELEKRYYCKEVGKEAWLADSGAYLGLITGLAWKERGQTLAAYPGPDGSIKVNHLSGRSAFYFIIMKKGAAGPVLVEPHRILTGE